MRGIWLQLILSVLRPVLFSYATFQVTKYLPDRMLLTTIGYVSFFGVVDVAVMAISRARYLSGEPADHNYFYRGFGTVSLIVVGVLFLGSISGLVEVAASYLIVSIYLLGSISNLFERVFSEVRAFTTLAVLELVTIIFIYVLFQLSGNAYLLTLLFASYPFARLATLVISRSDQNLSAKRDSSIVGTTSQRRFVAYAILQQVCGAASGSLPAFVAQVSGNYVNLAQNIVAFRLMHSLAAAGSVSINILAPRIFYNSTGQIWRDASTLILKAQRHLLLYGWVFLLMPCISIFVRGSPNFLMISIALLLPALVLLNIYSSLYWNIGRPAISLICQLAVFAISVGSLFLFYNSMIVALSIFISYAAAYFFWVIFQFRSGHVVK
jgi:hypothetical protein